MEDIDRTHEPEEQMPRERRDDNTIYVGKKNVMSYVLAVVTQFNQGTNLVKVKARGKVISNAIDVTQIVKNRFIPSLKISNFDVTTEELQSEDGSMRKVSSLTMTLEK